MGFVRGSMGPVISFDRRVAGVLTPLFALRGKADFGCGDTGSLREFIEWSAGHGFRCVQLLPVNETGADHSPYNAISSVAIEPTTIDPASLADLKPGELAEIAAEHGAEILREGSVRWAAVKMLKRAALSRAFANFTEAGPGGDAERMREFADFVKAEEAWLDPYALFRVLAERHGSEQWDVWPKGVRTLEAARKWLARQRRDAAQLERSILFVKYIQWVAFSQWRAVRRFAQERGVVLMGDVPFGVNYYSADVWAEPELFNLHWSGGAPPEPAFADDEFVQKWGQNWGVPLYDWPRHRASDFTWWRRRVRKVSEAFQLFRIDHVLGFYRIYGFPWRPLSNADFAPLDRDEAMKRTGGDLPRFHDRPDDTRENKAANCAQGEELLRVLQGEVGEGALVGEDLGTVPDYVRPSLLSLRIPGFKVPQWERTPGGGLLPGGEYERCSVATFATHDHEPLHSMWRRWMSVIETALSDPEGLGPARDAAWAEVRSLCAWAGFEIPRITAFEDIHERLIAALMRCNSWLAVLMITDVLGTEQRFNVPGSVGATNWSARLPADWQTRFAEKCSRIAGLVRAARR